MSEPFSAPDYVRNLAALDPLERDLRLRRWRAETIKAAASSLACAFFQSLWRLPMAVVAHIRSRAGAP